MAGAMALAAPVLGELAGWLRIGIPSTLWSGLEGQVDAVVQAAKQRIAGAGAVLIDVDTPTS